VELSYIFSAVRRRLWLVVLFAVIGLAVGYVARESQASTEYEARSVLLVSPPASANGSTVFVNDPDRYVIGQLSVLNSAALAERVAAAVSGETRQSVSDAISIEHEQKTDIVRIIARTSDPARSQQLANQYANLYITDLRNRAASAQAPGLETINKEIETLRSELKNLGDQLNAKPNDQVAISRKDQALAEYGNALEQQRQLELAATTRVTSEVVEEATLPTSPVSNPGNLFVAIGVAGGLLLGVLAAVITARMSPYVLDRYQIETELNLPVAGELGNVGVFNQAPMVALDQLPPHAERLVTRVCSRAEAHVAENKALIVAVVGTQKRAGTTMLSLAMAGRFARTDNNVVLIDFDQQDPELTDIAGGYDDGGIPALVSYLGHSGNGEGTGMVERAWRIDPTTIYTSTPNRRVRVLGVGSDPDGQAVRRSEIARVLDHASSDMSVVVVDGGSLLDTAAAEQLVRLADCVVLAMPAHRLKTSTLEASGRLLVNRTELLLPVITHPRRRAANRRRHRPVEATPAR
jgi:capsular polysaccharide biosynthesis protein/cellulose biosynthesis protein BcsQ